MRFNDFSKTPTKYYLFNSQSTHIDESNPRTINRTFPLTQIFKISGVLLKAFEEIHKITGSALSNRPTKTDKAEKIDKPSEEKKKERKESQHSETVEKKEEKKVQKKVQVEEQPKPEVKIDKKNQLAEKKKEKKKRHPDQPKAPLAAFFRFNNSSLDKIKS